MKITFGIITSQPYASYVPNHILTTVFNSIADEPIEDDVEILVVGGDKDWTYGEYRFIAFDESQRKAWITRKKNIITAEAKYDNIVYMHDYVALMPGWYKAVEDFGENYDICMHRILNADGNRFRDWTLWPHDLDHVWGPHCRECLLPYNVTTLQRFMYISGAYWMAKRNVMQEFPLDETLSWGESEDVLWSRQVRQKYKFSMNEKASVQFLKPKDRVFGEIRPETLKLVEDYNASLQPQ